MELAGNRRIPARDFRVAGVENRSGAHEHKNAGFLPRGMTRKKLKLSDETQAHFVKLMDVMSIFLSMMSMIFSRVHVTL